MSLLRINSSSISERKGVSSRGTHTSPGVGARCVRSSGSSFSTATFSQCEKFPNGPFALPPRRITTREGEEKSLCLARNKIKRESKINRWIGFLSLFQILFQKGIGCNRERVNNFSLILLKRKSISMFLLMKYLEKISPS